MYYSTPSVNVASCTAHITRNRNRAKIYGDSIYLKDGDNFEIELFNPTTARVLAKITINGKLISESGIVLKPGERVYLERFIDSNNKFVFDTYHVEKTNESLNAIVDNGLIKVDFYDEIVYTSNRITLNSTNPTYINTGSYWNDLTSNIGPSGIVGTYYSDNCFGGSTPNNLFMSTTTSSLNENIKGSNESNTRSKSIETGRIEKGEESKQSFSTTIGNFNYFPSSTVSYRLIPASQKPIGASEIRNYCTGCGSRIKKAGWKFCPSCGEKL